MDSKEHIPTTILRSHSPFATANDEEDHHVHPHSLSRLSMCSSSGKMDTKAYGGSDDDDDDDDRDHMANSDDGDADEEFSLASSDSDKEQQQGSHRSLPTTPRKWTAATQAISIGNVKSLGAKEYGSENEARLQRRRKSFPAQSERRAFGREKWESREESEYTVMTKPKGGRRSLCMDLDEVKACRDLGFELELPSRLAISCSCSAVEANDNTSSGGNSPINSWRISSPGDDPKDVKARLKIWAQAVALASSTSTL